MSSRPGPLSSGIAAHSEVGRGSDFVIELPTGRSGGLRAEMDPDDSANEPAAAPPM